MRRTGRAVGLLAAISLVLSPALALQPPATGNPVADMAFAIGKNRGLATATATEIGYYVGAETAGASLMTRILRSGPIKKAFGVAALAGIGYFAYKLAEGQYAPTGPEPTQAELSQYTRVNLNDMQRFVGYDEYRLFRKDQPVNTFKLYVGDPSQSPGAFLVFVRWVTDAQWSGDSPGPDGVIDIRNHDTRIPAGEIAGGTFKTWDSSPDQTQAVTKIENGVRYRLGWGQIQIDKYAPDPVLTYRWMNENAGPADAPASETTVTAPDEIPDNAYVDETRVATLIDEAIARAAQAHPEVPALRDWPKTTPEEVRTAAPEGTPARQVGTSRTTLPSVERSAFPKDGTGTEPGGGTTPQEPTKVGLPGIDLGIESVTPRLPGASVGGFTYSPGRCPALMVSWPHLPADVQPTARYIGVPDEDITKHCEVLESIAPWFRPFLLVLIFVVGFGIFRGRGG